MMAYLALRELAGQNGGVPYLPVWSLVVIAVAVLIAGIAISGVVKR